jgi:uncharacterized protein YcaQ
MTISSIKLNDARLIHLASQGLLTPLPTPATKADVLEAIRRMQLLQIDTIHVVARSQYLVLFSRLGNFDPTWLDELLVEKKLFEQWAHAACYVPMEDFSLMRRLVLDGIRSSYFNGWIEQNSLAYDVLNSIRANGPMRSADFKSPKEAGGWWNWKDEKIALEYWFSVGVLLVARREKFQRVYDLRERILPDWDDTTVPPLDEVYRSLVLKSVKAMGIARPAWVADYYRMKKPIVPAILKEMLEAGSLRQVKVEGWEEPALYVPENEFLLTAAANGDLVAEYTTLLSPFDPLAWDRARLRQLFDFDFMIQAYTVAEKRQYGYFPLPILHNGRLVGRLDAKSHRKEGIFEVKTLFLEPSTVGSEEFAHSLALAIHRCAAWHRTSEVLLTRCVPAGFEALIRTALNDVE